MTSKAEPSRWRGAVSGLLAAAAAMGISQLIAGLWIPDASPVIAVGSAAINHTPLPVKEWATSTFGTSDKTVLLLGVFAVVFLYAMAVGILAIRRLPAGFAGLGAIAIIGAAAAITGHGASATYALPTIGGALTGAFMLQRLVLTARAAAGAEPGGSGAPRAEDLRVPDLPDGGVADGRPSWTPSAGMRVGPGGLSISAGPDGSTARRSFLVTAGVSAAAATIGEVGGRTLATRKNVSAARAAIRLPAATVKAPALPPGVNLPVPGISPFVTPNGSFYRIDTALLIPQVDPASWQLRIHGLVSREVVITFDELLKRPLLEDYITLCCVSDPVSGPYIGNAKWLGASLASLLRSAGPLRGADQLLATSADGFTSGSPLSVVLDGGRDSLVAVAMNGTPLPTEHGFPARLVVPGLYGYVSACKWVVDLEVTTFAKAAGYWIPRGWSQLGPIKTESRIDVPTWGTSVQAGPVAVAGVAWAQHKGIEAVEVRVDSGGWNEATLATAAGPDTWRQWVWQWDATAGSHLIEARATDKTGYTQTSVAESVAPNGASGYPSVQVTVTG